MAHLLQSLQDYFVLDDINIDSWTWKLFYKVITVNLLKKKKTIESCGSKTGLKHLKAYCSAPGSTKLQRSYFYASLKHICAPKQHIKY